MSREDRRVGPQPRPAPLSQEELTWREKRERQRAAEEAEYQRRVALHYAEQGRLPDGSYPPLPEDPPFTPKRPLPEGAEGYVGTRS